MSTSEREALSGPRAELKKHLLYNAAGAAFLLVFGVIYEMFGHGVFSAFMVFAFTVPLVLGVLLYGVLLIMKRYPGRVFLNLWNSGIAVLAVGSVFKGVLDIYGTTNSLIIVYPIAGGALLAAALVCGLALKR